MVKKNKELFLNNPSELFNHSQDDIEDVVDKISTFIKGYVSFYGFKKAIIGLSGGIDSTVMAYLAVRALGEGNVYGVIIPSKFTSAEHIDFALKTCKDLNIEYNDFDIVHEYFDDTLNMLEMMGERSKDEDSQKIKSGNVQARMRMIILRDIAKKYSGLVLGTTNKTEMRLGYATIAGDGLGGVDIEPIADLYKTSIKEIAKFLKISEEIIIQAPSAELWENQKDEDELGLEYYLIDQILLGLELTIRDEELVDAIGADCDLDMIETIKKKIKDNEFKNKLPAMISV